ncbi:hypothetical protein GT348_09100 (plasmid) [Aristophania vespae]|uniref:Magnesium transporter MgtE intracellular domain-containing protein n=1 Tax=Aristophania vespae TaxID=2697033 RepID=A0A6P1NIY8_9PROT|nr:hypothetical protein [Aristophania vespae]QHI96504.1 hypothetical protein GT348_09100 [Aristophania vespae]
MSKVANISICLMLVLLALSLHSVAAQIENHLNKSNPEKAPEQKIDPSSRSHTLTEKDLGWKVLKKATHKKQPKIKEKEENPTQEEILITDPLTKDAEQALKNTIKEREFQTATHNEVFDKQKKNLEQEKIAINGQIQELKKKTAELSKYEEKKKKAAEQEIERLAHVYEQMPPRDAAAVFNVLDMRVLVPVAQHMTPRKVSAVIGGMLPDRANILTQYLIGTRKLK